MKQNKGIFLKTIALTAIMLAFLVAMMPTVSAFSNGTAYNYITISTTPQKVLIGQDLQFMQGTGNWTSEPKVYRYVAGILENIYSVDANYRIFNVNWPTSGAYFVSNVSMDPNDPATTGYNASLSVEAPTIPLSLKVGEKTVSTIAVGTNVSLDVSGINVFPEDIHDIIINGPEGQIKNDTPNNPVPFTNISTANLATYYAKGAWGIETSGWKVGAYTFQIKTKPEYACGLSAQSLPRELIIKSGKIDISAEKTSCVELQTIKLTVWGVPLRKITVRAFPLSAKVIFPKGVNDNPNYVFADHFNHTIDEDSTRTYAVYFNDTGSYTIKVIDWGANGVFDGIYVDGVPGIAGGDDSEDTVEIKVSEKAVTFDVPATVVIGQKFTIKGTANTGQRVTIAVDDYVYPELERLVIGPNGEFEREIDTSKPDIPPFTVPGCVNLKAYIDRPMGPGPIYPGEIEDGSAVIAMSETHLSVTLSKATVYPSDSFEVYGNASSDHVEIITISPNGGSGTGTGGLYGTTIYTVPTFCSAGHNFYKKIRVDSEADTGNYLILVLSPDRDEIFGNSSFSYIDSLLDLDGAGPELGAIDVSYQTQNQLLEILEDATIDALGSDDVMWIGYVSIKTIISCDSAGNEKNQFAPGETVYVKGYGLEAGTSYRIWIQDEPVNEGDALNASEDPSGTLETVTTDGDGNFGPTPIWPIPADAPITHDEHDIVVNKGTSIESQTYNAAEDGLDSVSVAGFTAPVVEVSTIILLSVGLLALWGYSWWRRKDN
ncbi:MAG: hypothetical protein EFT35_08040 [Methanophagales archaeon ANME-1-THS]|nr:MAG: hypothetical protein EFT35_08040 [Methanophagales archaeon ANME-1-THS]